MLKSHLDMLLRYPGYRCPLPYSCEVCPYRDSDKSKHPKVCVCFALDDLKDLLGRLEIGYG